MKQYLLFPSMDVDLPSQQRENKMKALRAISVCRTIDPQHI